MRTHDLFKWIYLRHTITVKRANGESKPWTHNPILMKYRFCNVYRELDTVTQWIKTNWRDPNIKARDVWFAMAVARLVNWPDSLEAIGFPVPWDLNKFVTALEFRKATKRKVFTGAYMIHADATFPGSKAAYLAHKVLTPMWDNRAILRPLEGDTLASFHKRLMTCRDMGSFMAGQVVCDTKYTLSLMRATDWQTWACPGPGSERGLNRVLGRPITNKWRKGEWLHVLQQLHTEINQIVDTHQGRTDSRFDMPQIHAQDLQNCLCEFDKYERVRLGEGVPRSLYPGS